MSQKRSIKNTKPEKSWTEWTIDWDYTKPQIAFPRRNQTKKFFMNWFSPKNNFFKSPLTTKETYLERLVENYQVLQTKKGDYIIISEENNQFLKLIKHHDKTYENEVKVIHLEYKGNWGSMNNKEIKDEIKTSQKVEKPDMIYFYEYYEK